MIEIVDFCVSPFVILGRLANRLVLENYMRALLTHRAKILKREAERFSSH
jgi:hypothetical protein